MLLLAAIAITIGVAAAFVGLGLLDLIGLITHLVYEGRLSTKLAPPRIGDLGAWSILIPVAGGLIVGLMARFGSERIRGHGIPEAIETILIGGSRMEPRLAVLKPISSAISIGTGGPFGAEGPIIVTGGAIGSLVGQLLHLTAAERRTLLVSGAAGGMTAVFGTPVAAVLLAGELLLFEWRPRSLAPVALAAASAEVVRSALAGSGLLRKAPLFPLHTSLHGGLPLEVAAGAALVGLLGGVLAAAMTASVYGAEDMFGRLRLHWMWWPALGGVVVGVGGLIDSRVLGVGYDTIGAELAGGLTLGALAALLVAKLVVWAIALGSNTSGGVLAPVLMIGAAMGGLLGAVLPGADAGTWAMIGMAATLTGVMRSPLTSIVFALELTHDVNAMPALLVTCGCAYLLSVLVLKRSILTEKVARRGYHVFREYEVDPLRALQVRDALASKEQANGSGGPSPDPSREGERPGVDGSVGSPEARRGQAFADEILREVADRMLSGELSEMSVIERADGSELGVLRQIDLLRAHERVLVEERQRERALAVRWRS
jgi:H+/Cl- antiporter ClcA